MEAGAVVAVSAAEELVAMATGSTADFVEVLDDAAGLALSSSSTSADEARADTSLSSCRRRRVCSMGEYAPVNVFYIFN